MRLLKKIVVTAVWVVLGLFLAVSVGLNIPAVQRRVAAFAASAVGSKLGTRVEIGRVGIGFPARIIIDRVRIDDQSGRTLLTVARMAANIGLAELPQGKIRVSSAQLFGPRFNIVQDSAGGPLNMQFVVDSLSGGDNDEPSKLDLQMNSFIIRHGELRFRQAYKAPRRECIDPSSLQIGQISAHLVMHQLTDSSINVWLKRLSLVEKSGLRIDGLAFSMVADGQKARLSRLRLDMPQSQLEADSIVATYRMGSGGIEKGSLRYHGAVRSAGITLADLAFIAPGLRGDGSRISLSSRFSGTATRLNVQSLEASSDGLISLNAAGSVGKLGDAFGWKAGISRLSLNSVRAAELVGKATGKPSGSPMAERIGLIDMKGSANGGGDRLELEAEVATAVGQMSLGAKRSGRHVEADVAVAQVDLGTLTANKRLGAFAGEAHLKGDIGSMATLKADISRADICGYSLQGIHTEASTRHLDTKKLADASVSLAVSDPALALTAECLWRGGTAEVARLKADVAQLRPRQLRLSDRWGDASFSFTLNASADKPDAAGNWLVTIADLALTGESTNYNLSRFSLASAVRDGLQHLSMDSDFGYAELHGRVDFGSLKQSLVAIVADKLPTMPGLPPGPYKKNNDFSFSICLNDSRWAQVLLGIPIEISKPLEAAGELSDAAGRLYIDLMAPSFCYNETFYRAADVKISSPMGALTLRASIDKEMSNGHLFHWNVSAMAADNRITGGVEFDNHSPRLIKGSLHADAGFALNAAGETAANVRIGRSSINFGDSVWTVEPSSIDYSRQNLRINGFAVRHNRQYVTLSGTGSTLHSDTITARLKDVDISYILGLVDFHSVEFDGFATGEATLAGLFAKQPEAKTRLKVSDFLFEKGRMGTLLADAAYNNELQQIDIEAQCIDDEPFSSDSLGFPMRRRTLIGGFISPQRGDVGLDFRADNTRMEFMQDICRSFLGRVDGVGRGEIHLGGTLKKLELTGQVAVDGAIDVSSLGTTYTLNGAEARLSHNKIEFLSDTITDRYGRNGVVTGAVFHENLKNFSYDIDIDADGLLSYDTHDFGEFSFYGTAFATGNCRISGRSGELNIDVNAVPEEGSILVYNVMQLGELTQRDFVAWHDGSSVSTPGLHAAAVEKENGRGDDRFTTNMRFNFVVNANPRATLRLIMDPLSGDYIDLMGNGLLRCQYYNKGSFDVFGNYTVDHGLYKLTIQNVLRRDFRFLSGGTIAFGGDPFAASLNLKAQYTLNGVSLSDLGLGNSFSSNNVRVDCLMNIGGTAGSPRVDFSLDLPTVNSEAKQMVYSLINSSEDLNNQVLYLLAVGRFYQQQGNNASSGGSQQNQTTLAMQSILSGTISQQINTLLAGVTKSSNWQFGANISTGDEGFNNAEYEGLFSGQLLNNRLLFDGQFGYRDKANATSSFIGDFDIKYLLVPSGNIAVRVYNQSNDRYFTRSSLNTQGIGLILKHDFNKLFPLWKKKKDTKQ